MRVPKLIREGSQTVPIAQHTKNLLIALKGAASTREGGEFLVRHGMETGRIYFHQGKVAWVVVSNKQQTFSSYLVDNTPLSSQELQEVFDECKRSEANFGETIVQWGLLDRETLRQLLLRHISICLSGILSWSNTETLFMPDKRTYKGSLTFELAEVVKAVADLNVGEKKHSGGMTRSEVKKRPGKKRAVMVRAPDEGLEPEMEQTSNTGLDEGSGLLREAKERGTTALEAHLAELRDVKGYLAAGIMTFNGVTLATQTTVGGINLETTGVVFNDIFRNAHEAAGKIGMETCNNMVITTPKGVIVMECSGVNAAAHIHFIVILETGGNQTLARITLQQIIPAAVAAAS